MKKTKLILPLIGVTALVPMAMPLVSCNKGGEDIKAPTFSVEESIMSNKKEAHIQLDWEETERTLEISDFAFQYGDVTAEDVQPESESGERPFKLKLVFANDVTEDITNGVFSFHYNDTATKTEGDASVADITIYTTTTFTVANSVMTSDKEAYIVLNWAEKKHTIEISQFDFKYNGTTIAGVTPVSFERANPFRLKLDFTDAVTDTITDGVFSFHYKDETSKTEGDASVADITIYKQGQWGDEQAHIIDNTGVTHLVTSLVDSRICDREARAIKCDDGEVFSRFSFNFELILNPSLTRIEDNFMMNCRVFNKPITIPTGVTSIGNSFLSICPVFNQPITLPNGLKTIGSAFLGYGGFNQPLTLPEGLTEIGVQFLAECSNFNQSLTLPKSLTKIGAQFLYNSKKMVSSINIQNLSAGKFVEDDHTLATNDENAPMYAQGIEIIADTQEIRDQFMNRFPKSEIKPFRNLK